MNELGFTLLPLDRPSPGAPEGISASAEVGLKLHRPLTTPAGEAMVTGPFYHSLRALHPLNGDQAAQATMKQQQVDEKRFAVHLTAGTGCP